jgi:phosphatidylserine decarboxylase
MKIAKGGWSWISSSIFVNLILLILIFYLKGSVFYFTSGIFVFSLLLSFLLCVFFRDPERKTGEGVVAVADGKIREISNQNDKEIGKCTMISTFMNIHNVHVNRMPLDGEIKEITHYEGKHIPAFKKESERNERVKIIIQTKKGLIKVILIAGTIARRIVPYVKKGNKIKKGEKISIIRLGSRVDVYLPEKIYKSIVVKENDRVIAGEDSIAEIND